MFNSGFPTATFNWFDNSGAGTNTLFAVAEDGLNVPFQFIMAERGEPGVIYYGAAAELTPILGSETFNESSVYFSPATRFLGTAMAAQGVQCMRLVDPAATVATLGLFAEVTIVDVIQYQVDSDGIRVVDSEGDFIPLMTTGQTPVAVTEPGIKIKWVVRQLTSQENYKALVKQTVVDGSITKEIYPVLAFKMRSQGLYGNRQGFRFYSTGNEMATPAEAIGAVLYRFAPVALATGVSTTAGSLPDYLGNGFADIAFKDAAVYTRTNTDYSARYTFGSNYSNANTGDPLLPYDVVAYGANIKTIGEDLIGYTEDLEGTDPYLIDLISGKNFEGAHYTNLEVDEASSLVVNSAVINYAKGGSDGEVSFAKLQELMVDWLEGSDHGEFGNVFQHPMTHFSDPGFAIETKYALLNMLDLRDNFKIDLSTQDVSLAPNTKAQDISTAQALLFRAQMHPESTINGVGCTRVGIYAHCGELVAGTPYTGIVPLNYNRLIQRRNLDGGSYIRGSSGGRPNSEVTLFRTNSLNWTADDDTSRSTAWTACTNTVMHASRTVIFYPALRTVYPNDTSLLSEDEVSDRVLYMMKIAREVWTIFVGAREAAESQWPRIEREIDNRIAVAFSGDNIKVKATVFQTAADANLGYVQSVNLNVSGTPAMRQMNFNVIMNREAAA